MSIVDRESRKYKPLLPPSVISPIATAPEKQKDNDDDKNETHSLRRYELQDYAPEDGPLATDRQPEHVALSAR